MSADRTPEVTSRRRLPVWELPPSGGSLPPRGETSREPAAVRPGARPDKGPGSRDFEPCDDDHNDHLSEFGNRPGYGKHRPGTRRARHDDPERDCDAEHGDGLGIRCLLL